MNTFTDDRERIVCDGSPVAERLREITVVPAGEVQSKHGTFLMDQSAADEVIAAFHKHGVDLPIDKEHETLDPKSVAGAVGWIKALRFVEGVGLRGLVEWTEAGRTAVRSGSLPYLSPVVVIRKSDRRVVEIHGAGLVTRPAIPGMERLAASQRRKEQTTMAKDASGAKKASPEQMVRNIAAMLEVDSEGGIPEVLLRIIEKLQAANEEAKETAVEDSKVANSVRTALGLKPDAGAAEVTLAMSLRGNGDGELAEMRARERDRTVKDILQPYIDKNVLNPNDLKAMSAARQLAAESPDRLHALFGNMRPWVEPGKTRPPSPRGMVIGEAERRYRDDEATRKLTSCRAYVNQALRDKGMATLSDSEERELITA